MFTFQIVQNNFRSLLKSFKIIFFQNNFCSLLKSFKKIRSFFVQNNFRSLLNFLFRFKKFTFELCSDLNFVQIRILFLFEKNIPIWNSNCSNFEKVITRKLWKTASFIYPWKDFFKPSTDCDKFNKIHLKILKTAVQN